MKYNTFDKEQDKNYQKEAKNIQQGKPLLQPRRKLLCVCNGSKNA